MPMPSATPIRGNILPDLQPLAVPIENLHLDERNPRRGNRKAIAASLAEFGQHRPVVVRKTGTDDQGRPVGWVIAGNHTVMGAQDNGWTHLAAVWTDDDEIVARARGLADNRTSELGDYDTELLLEVLELVRSENPSLLAAASYQERDLATLHNALARHREGLGDPDTAPDLPETPVTKPGDVWLLGDDHRLVCGSSTQAETYELLMRGERADLMWTDPPYGVSVVGGSGLTIQNDDEAGLRALLTDAFGKATQHLEPGASFYIAAPAGRQGTDFCLAIADVGWTHHQTLVWVKDMFVLGHCDYHYRHEDVIYGWVPGEGRHGRGNTTESRWYGDNSQDTVHEVNVPKQRKSAKKGGDADSVMNVPRPKSSRQHPTMKPVELVRRGIVNSSRQDDLVLDPFAGSGSTLIACHMTWRKARLIELDPRYADVICQRYQAFTGDKPVLERTEEPHDFS